MNRKANQQKARWFLLFSPISIFPGHLFCWVEDAGLGDNSD